MGQVPPPGSPITTISFPPTSFSTCITQYVLPFSSFSCPVLTVHLFSLPFNSSHRMPSVVSAKCDFARSPSLMFSCMTAFSIPLYQWLSSALTRSVSSLNQRSAPFFFVSPCSSATACSRRFRLSSPKFPFSPMSS